jgi:hypothetical protein
VQQSCMTTDLATSLTVRVAASSTLHTSAAGIAAVGQPPLTRYVPPRTRRARQACMRGGTINDVGNVLSRAVPSRVPGVQVIVCASDRSLRGG